ncbi:hypothetical protein E7811_08045 [Aliigemmobacter aestuarii]|uniref:Uncharacterized protein n=1 Tax=Aliigemmobacter aestuarii TaxID=1445661 RepID=A0A4S3MSS9_9RHOB|nr:hypothetical protein [Gemmobacter aestuarii]THD85628.1 hypothetical protein E7811_08045 [Gemmobacter aestuarii]
MDLISDLMLGLGSLGAAAYCYVLARRLKRFSTLETEMGGAIAVLSAQVDDMTRALNRAQAAARENADRLETLTLRAEAAAAGLTAAEQAHAARAPYEGAPMSDTSRRLRFVRRRPVEADEVLT